MKRIIIAEDDPSIQESISMILENEGYEVETFSNGEPILNGEYVIPDLFILDKQLIGVDGLDVCRFLKKNGPTSRVPVIMLSANPYIFKLAASAGADEAIEKPFRIKDLKEVIGRLI